MTRVTLSTHRRSFLKAAAVAGVGYWSSLATAHASRMANDKLNIAVIGAGGKGATDAQGCASQNIVALCDVDEDRAGKTLAAFPKAERFKDFRVMLERRKDIDAVCVATPDHTHAVASMMAMKLGKHVYCQKPLTHTVREARLMRDTAREMKVATQMGNQGTASDGLRRGVELVRAGAIGPVREVHIWTNRPIWPQGMQEPPPGEEVPKHLDWDLWLGPAADRPYNKAYCPFSWRGWWDFGTGAIGDMACHTANLTFMALKLTAPTSVEAEVADISPYSPPKSSVVRFDFPEREGLPPVKLTWYEGGRTPKASESSDGRRRRGRGEGENRAAALLRSLDLPTSGSLLIGERGALYSPNDYGAEFYLIHDGELASFTSPEPSLPRSPGHYEEWIAACKGGPAAMSNFDYAAPMTEAMLLGNVAMRSGKRIEWDVEAMKIPNAPEAEQYLHMEYRKGWTL